MKEVEILLIMEFAQQVMAGMGIESLSNSGRKKIDLLKVIKKWYLGKISASHTHRLKGSKGCPVKH